MKSYNLKLLIKNRRTSEEKASDEAIRKDVDRVHGPRSERPVRVPSRDAFASMIKRVRKENERFSWESIAKKNHRCLCAALAYFGATTEEKREQLIGKSLHK